MSQGWIDTGIDIQALPETIIGSSPRVWEGRPGCSRRHDRMTHVNIALIAA